MVLVLLGGCGPSATPAEDSQLKLSGAFDPENAQEYGIRGIYVGQGIKEAMDQLKPSKYDFMDAISRASMTVDQLAQGEGTIATGMLVVDNAQLMLKVRNGVVESILVGGIEEANRDKFKTNRGLALYDSPEKMKQLYGEASGENVVTYQGSKYMMQYNVLNGKVIGFRFETVSPS